MSEVNPNPTPSEVSAAAPAAPTAVADALYGKPAEAAPAAETPAEVPAPEAPPAETPPAESAPAEAPPAEEAPAPVEYNFTFPEGFQQDEAQVNTFKEIATEAKLPPEIAQKFVDLGVQMATKAAAENTRVWTETNTNWVKELEADAAFSTPAAKEQSLKLTSSLIDEFGRDPGKLREALALTGAGNNPEIVHFVLALGKTLVEGEPTMQGRPTSRAQTRGPRTLGTTLYPEQGS